jgi:hypothetical protein
MIALPPAAEFPLYRLALAFRPVDVLCSYGHYDPYWVLHGRSLPPGVVCRSLMPYEYDSGTARLIDACVAPAVKLRAAPCHWFLILAHRDTPLRLPRCCFRFRPIPATSRLSGLVVSVLDGELILRVVTHRDRTGRRRSSWVVHLLGGGHNPSIN